MAHEDPSLDRLPVKNGFRLRGGQMTRIETFTDAAFAFAMTLLVVSLDVPSSYAELVDALTEVPAFALSAVLLMAFWAGHHTWSRRFGLDDVPTILLSCLLVFTVLVYVYPLRFLMTTTTAWISYLLGWQRGVQEAGIRVDQVNRLFVVYGAGFVAMCGALILLNLHAWRERAALRLNAVERHETRAEIVAWAIVGAAGVLSIVVAVTVPPSWVGLPGWTYSLLAIVMPIYAARSARRRRRLEAGGS